MNELLVDVAPWIALGVGTLAFVVVAWNAYATWRAWNRARVTQQAATALLDVHAQRIDLSMQRLDDQAGILADDGHVLATALAELRADVGQLRWMLDRIPAERARFMREVSHLLLPTDERDENAENESDENADNERDEDRAAMAAGSRDA